MRGQTPCCNKNVAAWSAYPKKAKKPLARAAYEKLAPDADLDAIIAAKAKALAHHHAEHETEMRYIKEPANWPAGEGWDEDFHVVYQDRAANGATKRTKSHKVTSSPHPRATCASRRLTRRLSIDASAALFWVLSAAVGIDAGLGAPSPRKFYPIFQFERYER